MPMRSPVHPGHRGAQNLLTHYGARFVCVRYSSADKRQKRRKTVELSVAEEDGGAPTPSPQNADVVHLTISWPETSLRRQLQPRGGRWNSQRGLGEPRYEQVRALG